MMNSKREFILCSVFLVASNAELLRFPDNFKFGVSTGAYQTEGAWNVSDKGESIWDYGTHKDSTVIKDHTNADNAAESYYFYKKDVELLKQLGVHFYRFSISWPRLLPNGFSNKVSKDGLRYYNNLINELIANDIEPVVTLYHWDLPQVLQQLGGWTSTFIADFFEDYARVVFKNFGDRVKTWITFNEPMYICYSGYGLDRAMPLLNMSGIADYLCSKTVLLAHAKAYRLYHAEFYDKFQGRVGLAEVTPWSNPSTDSPADIEASEIFCSFMLPWFTDPIYTGDFPKKMKELVALRSKEQGYARSRLPEFTQEEKELLKGSSDFFGLTHYITNFVSAANFNTNNRVPSMFDDMKVDLMKAPNYSNGSNDLKPDGFRATLNWVKDRYNDPEILIFENGYGVPHIGNSLIDEERVTYFKLYLNAMLDAMHKDGVNITYYSAWSLMDNFEWLNGYTYRFGFYEVDFDSPNKTRTARKSALVYKEIIRSKVIDYKFEPASMDFTLGNNYIHK